MSWYNCNKSEYDLRVELMHVCHCTYLARAICKEEKVNKDRWQVVSIFSRIDGPCSVYWIFVGLSIDWKTSLSQHIFLLTIIDKFKKVPMKIYLLSTLCANIYRAENNKQSMYHAAHPLGSSHYGIVHIHVELLIR